jgi:hypothetical protein
MVLVQRARQEKAQPKRGWTLLKEAADWGGLLFVIT